MSPVRTAPPYRDNAGSAKPLLHGRQLLMRRGCRSPAACGSMERHRLCQGRLALLGRQRTTAASMLLFLPSQMVPDQERLTQRPSCATSTQTSSWRQTQLLRVETAAAAAACRAANSQLFLPCFAQGSYKCLDLE